MLHSLRFSARLVLAVALLTLPSASLAQNQSSTQANLDASKPNAENITSSLWLVADAHSPAVQASAPWIRPAQAKALTLDLEGIRAVLNAAPREAIGAPPAILYLPDPTGAFQAFQIWDAPVMEAGLAAQFPTIRTIVGQGLSDPTATLRADITLQGFHAQVLASEGDWYIDPYSRDDTTHYSSYFKRTLKSLHRWACENPVAPQNGDDGVAPPDISFLSSGTTLRTYRVAVAATAEYTSFHGGTVALGQSAIVTAINRVTGVYERELTIRLTLVANNSSLVYTNASTDPYTNGSGGTMLGQNQTTIDGVIGSGNYDIGHVFSTGGGGVAGLGVVCVTGSKARGVTGQGAPTGDPFWIDYVAHEMGHQFGADHTFNSVTGNCSGNRNAATAYEPGSASTIMGYAGICGADDLQPNSDAYFHSVSFDEIRTYVAAGGGTCGTATATGNSIPTVTGPGNFTIPINTPIILTATGSDANADALTYCWEERELGGSAALTAADNGTIPLVRSLNPIASPTRFVPPLANVLANTVNQQQRLPQLARTWNWRATVRDNRANGGGINQADIVLTVAGGAGPFTVTSPSTAVSWAAGSLRTITWNVASTNVAPVSVANVAIELSTDGGNTFPITIAASVPNTGSANVTIPNNQTTNGRIRVRALGNVFYNVNQGGLVTITAPVSGVVLTGTGANTIADSTGNGNSNGRIDPGETAIRVTVPIVNTGTLAATSVVGTLSSSTPTVTVTTNTASYANLAASGGSASNAAAYVINVSPSHVCGNPINLSLAIASTQGSGTYAFTLPTGLPGGSGSPTTFTYTGPVVAIPDNNAAGASATLNVSGLTGTITNVRFAILGSACNSTAGSTTVGLDHTYVSDLVGRLTSPSGTQVVLFTNPGSATANGGNNFCNTVFDDAASTSIQSITQAGNPYTASFSPQNPLAGFVGANPNGTWTFNVADTASVDTGSIRNFSITITTSAPPSCTPPNNNICPTFTNSPSPATACPGASASFTVLATGTPTPTFQWRKNGVNINTATNPSAATATLTLSSVTVADAASYDCVASNACGSIASSAAALTVGGPTCSPCDDIDFNNDGLFPDDADLLDFLSVLAGGACSTAPTPGCNDIDFNNDGLFPDDSDLLTYLSVLAGQPCTP